MRVFTGLVRATCRSSYHQDVPCFVNTGMTAGMRSPDSAPTSDATSSEQRAAALTKYRKYAALHSQAASPRGTEVPLVAGAGDTGEPRKWSDVGKHERLFDPAVSILRDRPASAGANAKAALYPKHPPAAAGASAKALPFAGLVLDDDGMHDSMEYAPESPQDSPPRRGALHNAVLTRAASMGAQPHRGSLLSSSITSNHTADSADGIVEVFIQSDSSNPASPERMKPNKPLFRPPFSKPVFNEFTGHSAREKNSSGAAPGRSASVKVPQPTGTVSGIVTSGTASATTSAQRDHRDSDMNSSSLSSKARFDLYANRKGASYEYAPDKESEDFDTPRRERSDPVSSTAGDVKGVRWADAKASNFGGGESAGDKQVGNNSKRGSGGYFSRQPSQPAPGRDNSWLSWKASGSGNSMGISSAGSGGGKKAANAAQEGGGSPNYTRL
jgi:hypothetical protein